MTEIIWSIIWNKKKKKRKANLGCLDWRDFCTFFVVSSFLAQVAQRSITVANKASNVISARVIYVTQWISSRPGTQQPSECCSAWFCATLWCHKNLGTEGRPVLRMVCYRSSVCSSAGAGTHHCCPFQQGTDTHTEADTQAYAFSSTLLHADTRHEVCWRMQNNCSLAFCCMSMLSWASVLSKVPGRRCECGHHSVVFGCIVSMFSVWFNHDHRLTAPVAAPFADAPANFFQSQL